MKFIKNRLIIFGIGVCSIGIIVQADLLSNLGKLIKPENLLKTGGVVFLINKFGGDINKAMNGLTHHKDTLAHKTKVVPILSVSLVGSGDNAIGAVQVMGPASALKRVVAVAQPEASLFGMVKVKALIPVSSKNVTNISRVDNVSVTGIVDLKL